MSSKQGENYPHEEKQNHILVTETMWRKITQPAADLENEYEHCGRAHINADTMMMRCYSYVPITSFITQSRASFLQLDQAGPTTGTILFLYRFPVLNLIFFITINKNHS